MDIETTVINNKTYMEVDKIDIKDITYVFLINFVDKNDFLIRKLKAKDGKVYYSNLDTNEEFDKALLYFAKKHGHLLNEE